MSFNFSYIRTDDFSSFGGGPSEPVVTRDNYEAWFVLYIDNELSPTERKVVDYFVQQNPDLEEELVMLQQSVLRADDQIVFTHKDHLLKNTAAQGPVNESNYEAYFVQYGDDELTTDEKILVEQFVAKHPHYSAEFELIQQAKLVPDNTITFPEKTYLFRTEEDDNKVIAFPWWRIAAAAVVLLVIGSLGWYLSNYDPTAPNKNDGKLANTKTTHQKNTSSTTVDTPNHVATQTVTNSNNDVAATPATTTTTTVTDHHDRVAQNDVAINSKKNIFKPRNISAEPDVQHTNAPKVIPVPTNEVAITAKPVTTTTVITNASPAVNTTPITNNITSQVPQTVTTVAAVEASEDYVASNTSTKKTPLRGLLRRVSRVVDKVTNNEDDGKPSLRIANLEIALK
jgi:hypothetical protein